MTHARIIRPKYTKIGQPMAMIKIIDHMGTQDVVVLLRMTQEREVRNQTQRTPKINDESKQNNMGGMYINKLDSCNKDV